MWVGIEERAIFEDRDIVGKCAGFDGGFLARLWISNVDALHATGAAIDAAIDAAIGR